MLLVGSVDMANGAGMVPRDPVAGGNLDTGEKPGGDNEGTGEGQGGIHDIRHLRVSLPEMDDGDFHEARFSGEWVQYLKHNGGRESGPLPSAHGNPAFQDVAAFLRGVGGTLA